MKRAGGVVLLLALMLSGCAGRAQRAGGPAPEYERPVVPPWDAGKSADPLEQAVENAEPVTESEARPDAAPGSDAGPPVSGDR